jgi:hypothetical protein
MDLAKLVRDAVKTADMLTTSLQPEVTHKKLSTKDLYGAVVGESLTKRKALVDQTFRQIRTTGGQMISIRATITFLRPVAIDPQDTIILPDGTTGPIVTSGGFVDAGTKHGFYTEIYLGA